MDTYLAKIFSEIYQEDGLVVMGRGLGIEKLLVKLIRAYSLTISDSKNSPLVFCLNLNGLENSIIDLMLAEGVAPNLLPKVLNNESPLAQRQEMYSKGGVFFITSRIFIVDLLDDKVSPERIAGIILYNANRISETSIESFIIKVYREKNRTGFIKALTEEPETLSTSYSKLEILMQTLSIKKLFLWPRFRLELSDCLSRGFQSEVIELSLSLTPNMKIIQNSILVCMNLYVKSLKNLCPKVESDLFTLENSLFQNFDHILKQELMSDWHNVSFKVKQYINDLQVLRKLLNYLIRYDNFSFYYLLLKLHYLAKDSAYSLWLTSEASNSIFKSAKERVYCIKKIDFSKLDSNLKSFYKDVYSELNIEDIIVPVLEAPPKWKVLLEILKEIRNLSRDGQTSKNNSNKRNNQDDEINFEGRILLIVKDELSLNQIRDLILHGSSYVMDNRFRWFISQQSADIRAKANQKVSRVNLLKNKNLDNNEEIDLTESSIHNILSNYNLESESESNQFTGYLGLGLTEYQVKSLSHEQKLILIEEKNLKLKPPISSDQNKNIDQIIENEHNSNKLKKVKLNSNKEWVISGNNNSKNSNSAYENLNANFLDPNNFITILTHNQIHESFTCLSDINPQYIILYDTDVYINRRIETFQSISNFQIKIYFLQYESSTEEHRYIGALNKEKKSFENLILTKEHMIISLPDHPLDLLREKQKDLIHTNIKKASSIKNTNRKIVIDIREFRSTLPSILYSNQFQIIPRTITVGDYVLSPEICVERKGISDLFQSFNSGRLYNQVESMSKHYKFPCLLIEFSQDKTFGLVAVTDISQTIQANSILSKIVILSQTFPNLRILWSKSPENTTEIFKLLVSNQEEVDVNKAVRVGNISREENELDSNFSEEAYYSAIEILKQLPGINDQNVRALIDFVPNLSSLSKETVDRLTPVLGPVNAKKLVSFFNQRV